MHDKWLGLPLQAVCEESSNDYKYGVKKPRKERYVAGVITPASPHYVHGLIDSEQVRAAHGRCGAVRQRLPSLGGDAASVGAHCTLAGDCRTSSSTRRCRCWALQRRWEATL